MSRIICTIACYRSITFYAEDNVTVIGVLYFQSIHESTNFQDPIFNAVITNFETGMYHVITVAGMEQVSTLMA
jgi:hypothetical protein